MDFDFGTVVDVFRSDDIVGDFVVNFFNCSFALVNAKVLALRMVFLPFRMAKLFNRLIIFEPRFFAAFIVFFFMFLSIGFALLTAVDNNGLASSLPALNRPPLPSK